MKNNCLAFDRYRDLSLTIVSLIIIILILVLLVVSIFVKFNFITSYNGIVVKEDDFYVGLVVSADDLVKIQKSSLIVDKDKKDFSIVSIGEEFVLTGQGSKKYVVLKFEFDDNEKIVNNVIKLNFINRCSIFSKLKEMI